MTIDGNMKFFELSKALYKNGATATATSGDTSASNVLDLSEITRWQSVGSTDNTTETLTITFDQETTISRILFKKFNFKSFTVTPVTSPYILDGDGSAVLDDSSDEIEDGGATLDFTNVISSTNSTAQTGISETSYDKDNQYYEFDEIYCSGLTIRVTEAVAVNDVADQEKYCYICIPTIEIDSNQGTFDGFPVLSNTTDLKTIRSEVLTGKNKLQKLERTFSASIVGSLISSQNDVRIMDFLKNSESDFLFFPCGGKLPDSYFRFESRPYNFDVYQMQASESGMPEYINNVVVNATQNTLKIIETT